MHTLWFANVLHEVQQVHVDTGVVLKGGLELFYHGGVHDGLEVELEGQRQALEVFPYQRRDHEVGGPLKRAGL